MKNLIFLFALLFLAIACNTQRKATQNSNLENFQVENIYWSLVEFDGKSVPESVIGKVHILLSKEDTKLSGSNGCNRLMGSYNISNGTQISFSRIASTRMACQSKGWDETEFNQMLETANNFTVSDNKLMLNVGRRAPLAVFIKVEKNEIVYKYWKLKELDGKKVEMDDNQEREQYFILREDGTITGFAGCNQFSGSFNLDVSKSRIKFENMLSTLRACPDVNVDESEFLKVFNLTDNYTMVEDKLTLNIERRAPLAVFEAVYF
jgi:heat shock protein HslJ